MTELARQIRAYPLATALLVASVLVLLPLMAWLQTYGDQLRQLSLYDVFPLFGLVAFSLMLGHFVIGALATLARADMQQLKSYYRLTSYIVLFCLLLHPGLFVWQLFQDGYGLPPQSYWDYVGASLRVFVLLGSISFVIFLLFELKRWYGARSWWHWVERASDVAMVLVFVHGLFLGSQIQSGWFRVVWILYGGLLISCLGYAVAVRRSNRNAKP